MSGIPKRTSRRRFRAAASCGSAAASSAWPGRDRHRAGSRRPGGRVRARRLRAGAAAPADPAHLVVVRQEEEPVPRRHLVLQRLDARLEELDHAATLIADEVVMVVAGVQALVAVTGLPDAKLSDDARLDEELERAVDRRARDLLVLPAEAHEQLVRFDVLVFAEHF